MNYKFITKEECLKINKFHRWEYWDIVIEYLKIIGPETCLELGSKGYPLFKNADTMGKNKIEDPTFLWNATNFPWPIDKKYDVFVALQVWEHLNNYQEQAFKEVSRISEWAILSFPYKWKSETSHGKITKSKISKWTNNIKPFIKPRIIRSRIIYLFNFFKQSYEKDIKIKNLLEKI